MTRLRSGGTTDRRALLTDRFRVPRRPVSYVDRPRLGRALDQAAEMPLTLVSAPAGSGKTTAVAAWAAGRAAVGSIGWLTFEDGDVGEEEFWRYTSTSLEQLDVKIPMITPASADPERSTLIAAALDLAAREDPIVLVLDGYQFATREVASDLDFLVRHADGHLHAVVLTRTDPLLALYRYRLNGTLTEIRAADLAFDRDEVADLLAAHDVEIADEAITALAERTRGWAAGLRFAALLLRDSDDPDRAARELPGDSGDVAEFLVAEVLDAQPADVRNMLLRTSVVDVLRPGLVEALGGQSAGKVLEQLARAETFVNRLVEHPGCYRYQGLFRDLLRAELTSESPTLAAQMHHTAAEWLAASGFTEEAVQQAAVAQEWADAAAHLLDGLAVGQLLLGSPSLLRALQPMPDGVGGSPGCIVRAALALSAGNLTRCGHELARARSDDASRSATGPAAQQLGLHLVEALHAGTLADATSGQVAADRAHSALSVCDEHRTARHPELRMLVEYSRGLALMAHGDLAAARRCLSDTAATARRQGPDSLLAASLGLLALLASVDGRLRDAQELSGRALAPAQNHSGSKSRQPAATAAELALAWSSIERDDLRYGRDRLERASRCEPSPLDGVARAMLPVAQARIRRLTGDIDSAGTLLDSTLDLQPATDGWLVERIRCERARVELARGRPDHAVKVLAGLDPASNEVGEILASASVGLHDEAEAERVLAGLPARGTPASVRVGALVAAALLHLRRRDRAAAIVRLDHAVRTAAPEHIRRPFREAPTDLRRLLDTTPALAGALRHPNAEGAEPTVVEPLTAKEKEVLAHLADLLSTDEIAGAMFVSVNTVRTHVRNILRKLGVSRRGDAVRRARRLKLIAT